MQTITALRRSERRAAKARTHGASGVSDNDDAWDDDDDEEDHDRVLRGVRRTSPRTHRRTRREPCSGRSSRTARTRPARRWRRRASPLSGRESSSDRQRSLFSRASTRGFPTPRAPPRASCSSSVAGADVSRLQGPPHQRGPSKVADRSTSSRQLRHCMPLFVFRQDKGARSSDDVGSSARTSSDSLHAAYDAINYLKTRTTRTPTPNPR